MGFYTRLQDETAVERQALMAVPIIGMALNGEADRATYVAFLTQAYHHVKHTLPLLMAAGARLPESKEWLRTAIAEYIEEECGHQEWILNDIRACGIDAELVRHGTPALATELLVSYAYDVIQRINPLGFFGMVLVLEGTSVNVATRAARAIQQTTGLPDRAFSYLLSHGDLDQGHIKFFEGLMDQVVDEAEQNLLIHCAKNFYVLYADVLRTPTGHARLIHAV